VVTGTNAGNRRALVHVHGIVQGVGFRPYIYQLAQKHRLGGWVRNESNGVEIEVAGQAEHVEAFLRDLPAQTPPLARIVRLEVSELAFSSYDSFTIIRSRSAQSRSALIAPDVCTCRDCLMELLDPRDRRYRYPFINCTNCGPRYTLIKDIPYDREKTTMAGFTMCPACRAEYDDPGNRRFHAQPNACWECGPQVWLQSASGRKLAERDEAVREAVRLLGEGAIIAIKGLGGFHLAVAATDDSAVSRLRGRKIREEKPFAVMFSDMEAIRRYCEVGEEEEALLTGLQRPIVLLGRRPEEAFDSPGPKIAPSVAPRNRSLGAFLPYTPLHFLLFDSSPYDALVMTSGNQSDEPIVMTNKEAAERLSGIADYFLFHDRDIYMRCDDSIARVVNRRVRSLRRARGHVPVPVFLGESMEPVLGVGAELKNTVCLTRKNEAFLSQHIGDLENLETLRSFEHVISHLQRILEIEPQCIVHDLHPDYLSTQWALERKDVPRLAVQHHHAHIASVVAENRISGPVLGLALDGTGYGSDGTVWGGEILRVDGSRFERLGHLRHVGLPGGNQAVKEPWRMALSYLWSLDESNPEPTFKDFLDRWPRDKQRVLIQMLERGVNTPLTSSCGRLFDAASALVGLRDRVTYEGQAAIEFEQVMEPDDGRYEGEARKEESLWILDPFPMMRELIEDVRRKRSAGIISARFHNGLVSLLIEAARRVGAETGLKRIALSGGVFQNAYLLERLETGLADHGFEVFSHVEVPSNDGCIALGQAYVGAKWLSSSG
jgi:hydrogenase maturation protein HypF